MSPMSPVLLSYVNVHFPERMEDGMAEVAEIEVLFKAHDSKVEGESGYYYVKISGKEYVLSPERAMILYKLLESELLAQKDIIQNWRGIIIRNPGKTK